MSENRTPIGSSAAPLDAVLGLTRTEDEGEWTVLRLDPSDVAVGATDPVTYLHGGALATCVDTAAWESMSRDHGGSWVVADLRIDFVRLGKQEPHKVRAKARRVGRRQAVVDVEITPWDDPSRLIALGRVLLSSTS
jgi:uncharacterized protein (TIGR00369 family)